MLVASKNAPLFGGGHWPFGIGKFCLGLTMTWFFFTATTGKTSNHSIYSPNDIPLVCSHQLLNAPNSSPSLFNTASNTETPDGSLAAMRSFWTSGVRCFDIDVVTLKDGNLLASHPSRLAKSTNGAKAEDHSLSSIRNQGADPVEFPLLEDILEEFSRLRQQAHEPPFYTSSDRKIGLRHATNFPLQGALLNLDLKGPHLTEEQLQKITHQITSMGIKENVAILVAALLPGEKGPGIDILRILGSKQSLTSHRYPAVRLGLVLRDRVSEDLDVSRIKAIVEEYSSSLWLLAPSFKFSKDWFHQIQRTIPLPITAWTIDSAEDLEIARQAGISTVIANRPMDYHTMTTEMKA